MEEPEIRIRRFSRDKRTLAEEQVPPAPEPQPEAEEEEEREKEISIADIGELNHLDSYADEDIDDSFLDELKGEAAALPESPIIPEAEPPSSPKRGTKKPKGKKKAERSSAAASDFDDLFDSINATPLLGKDRRELLTKIQEYKCLFPAELKTFKVKPNASAQQLQDALNECEVIVSCTSGFNQLMDEAILSVIQVVEGVSSRTENWDVTGTAASLRGSAEFKQLCKRLYLKHRLFADVPVEGQLCILIAGQMMAQRQMNKKRREVAGMLNQPL